jgi:hypothetical protein
LGANLSEQDTVAIEGWVGGIENEDVTTPYLRTGDLLVFLAARDGRITQDHSYVTGSTQRIPPVGLKKVRYVHSPSPIHPPARAVGRHVQQRPGPHDARVLHVDGTVQAMVSGAPVCNVEQQIAREERSNHVFPGRKIGMMRWLSNETTIAVEFDWQGVHYKDASRSLHTIAGCYLRLRDGLIAVDHTYKPTGAA